MWFIPFVKCYEHFTECRKKIKFHSKKYYLGFSLFMKLISIGGGSDTAVFIKRPAEGTETFKSY